MVERGLTRESAEELLDLAYAMQETGMELQHRGHETQQLAEWALDTIAEMEAEQG